MLLFSVTNQVSRQDLRFSRRWRFKSMSSGLWRLILC